MRQLTDIGYIRELMEKYGLDFRKEFGQNFLISPEIPRRMASFAGKNVLEIGPGVGCLTAELSAVCEKVVCVEIDRGLIPLLGETLSECPNVEVINGDIMKTDLRELCLGRFGDGPVTVCANLPYYITTPVIMKFLEFGREFRPFENIIVMIQNEVAQRLTADEKSPLYGAVTAAASYYAEIKKLFGVGAGCFIPAPKVDSAVISLKPYVEPPVRVSDEKIFFRTIRGAFAQRRKTLVNSLMTEFGNLGKEGIAGVVTDCGFDINIRGEKLSLEDFAKLSDGLNEAMSRE